MARTHRTQAQANRSVTNANGETITSLDQSDPNNPDNVPEADLTNTDGQIAGSAVTPEDLEDKGPPVKRFTVIQGGIAQTQANGPRSQLKPGKVIDELNYDIGLLKRQGIKLAPFVESEQPAEDFG